MRELRPYQKDAVDSVYTYLREKDGNPCVVIPTGGGKSLILASICKDALEWGSRVLLLSHVKELLVQNRAHICEQAPELAGAIGVHSAGLKSRDTDHPVIVAGIQSVYSKACELGRFDFILVDEAHSIPDDGEGMYRRFLADARVVNPEVRLIGFTATPYRMKTGMICGPDKLLSDVCYEVGVKKLIDDGYLCKLIGKAGILDADLSDVRVRCGEYVEGDLEKAMDTDVLVNSAVAEIIEYTWNRQGIIVFASGVNHGKHIATALEAKGQSVATVFGETPGKERDAIISGFKARKIKFIVNVGVLTTGFDAPHIDCVAMVRPTLSPGLYYQMAGRGLRLADGKENCLILDFANNILTHGPIDAIKIKPKKQAEEGGAAPAKKCPNCNAVLHAAVTECEFCGHIFGRELHHKPVASHAMPLSGQTKTETKHVLDVAYSVHQKRTGDGPPTMRVEYFTELGLRPESVSEWICIEHDGWARAKAENWWRLRSHAPTPATVETAVNIARKGALANPEAVTVVTKAGEKWPSIVGYKLGAKPTFEREPGDDFDDDGLRDKPAKDWSAYEDELPF